MSAKEILCPKVHDPSGRNGKAEIRQARIKIPHPVPDWVSVVIGDDVDERVRVVAANEIVVLDRSNAHA
jgi:hypothetical protein